MKLLSWNLKMYFFFSFFAFLIGVGVMLTTKKPAGNV